MSASEITRIHHEDEDLDDELDHFMLLMMGEYQKRRHKKRKRHRGSVFGHKVYNQEREEHARKLYCDYFAEKPTYPEKIFRRCFRMSSHLFKRIAEAVEKHDKYFTQKKKCSWCSWVFLFAKSNSSIQTVSLWCSSRLC
jgi:hypothetical protein